MRGRPFEVGNKSGQGRRRGSRNKRTVFLEAIESNGAALIKQCQLMALKGDPTALRLCIERLLPPCKPPSGRFRLPAVRTAADLVNAFPVVMQAVARGQVSAHEGEAIANMLEIHRRAIETGELDARLRALEQSRDDSSS
jgi:hypothetical protein